MEALIKINAVSDSAIDYQDGDIVDAFSVSRIRLRWAADLCNVDHWPLDAVSGLRDITTPAFNYLEAVSRYRFTRVNATTVLRENLETQASDEFNATANDQGERIDAPAYISKLTRNKRHKVFGSDGAEIWHSETRRNLDASAVWDAIESPLGVSRLDYSVWKFSPLECSILLPVKLASNSEISSATADDRRAGVFEMLEAIDPQAEPTERLIARRKWSIPYWDLSAELGINVDDVRNLNRSVDARESSPHIDETMAEKDVDAWQL